MVQLYKFITGLKVRWLKSPDESFEDEIVHLVVKNTSPVLNIFAVYLEVERGDKERISFKEFH